MGPLSTTLSLSLSEILLENMSGDGIVSEVHILAVLIITFSYCMS